MSTFGIIIATYGGPEWAELAHKRALPSALLQNADEILIDHYTDHTIAQARNELAARAESDWLVFLDADDELDKGYIAHMRRAISQPRLEARNLILHPRVSYVRKGKPSPPRYPVRRGTLKDDNFIIVGAGIRRETFSFVGGFSDYPHGFEDWSLWAKAWKRGAQIVDVPRAVYIAHVNQNSKHRTAWRDRQWQVEMHEKVRRELWPEEYA